MTNANDQYNWYIISDFSENTIIADTEPDQAFELLALQLST